MSYYYRMKKPQKPGRGKPPMYGEKMDFRIVVRLPEYAKKALELRAGREGVTIGRMVREIVVEALKP